MNIAESADRTIEENPPTTRKTKSRFNITAPASAERSADDYDGRPVIDVSCNDLKQIAAATWAAIERANAPPSLFRQGNAAVRLEHGDQGEPIIRKLNFRRLKHFLARAAVWNRNIRDEAVQVTPPSDVVHDVLATPDYPLPVLTRIVEAPVFAADGKLQTNAGYHAASHTIFAPAPGFKVPEVPMRPTTVQLQAARQLICEELLGDFPFIGDSELAHAVACLLLPFARDLIAGPTPLHLFEKPTPGTGATLIAEMISYPAIGRPIPAMTEGRDEDDWRKRITAKLRSGSVFALIDNLRRRLDSAAVSSAITSPTWEDRLLGQSEVVRIPVRCTWLATGNNPAISNEIARRTVRIRVDARVERPWLRPAQSFRHPNLRQWAIENRGQLVWAALTIIQAWIAAGRPQGNRSLGMFEGWSRNMGGILTVAGIDGFLGNLEDFYVQDDPKEQAWLDFVAAWWHRFQDAERQVSHLWPIATGDAGLPLGTGNEQSQRIVLGQQLADKRDRTFSIEIDGAEARLVVQRGKTVSPNYS